MKSANIIQLGIIMCTVIRPASCLSNHPTDRRSMLRDQLLLPLILTLAPEIAHADSASEILSNSNAVVGNIKPPTPTKPVSSSGFVWKTMTEQAVPATPSSVSSIIQHEMLGPCSELSSGILCVSERHDDFEHHKVQLKILMTMRKLLVNKSKAVAENLSIGMEMFMQQHQGYLDRFVTEADYSVNDLMHDTNWDVTWGYDIMHYLPILMFAKKSAVRIVGLHPSDEQMEKVRRQALEDTGGCSDAAKAAVFSFRDDYMADTAATHMHRHPDGWVVLFAGERHILKRNGIPSRALRGLAKGRLSSSPSSNRGVFTIVPRTVPFPLYLTDALGKEEADYVWYIQRDPEVAFKEHDVNAAPRESFKRFSS